MLCHLQGNVQMLWQFLRWKYLEHSQKKNGTTLPRRSAKVANNKNSDSFAAHFATEVNVKDVVSFTR